MSKTGGRPGAEQIKGIAGGRAPGRAHPPALRISVILPTFNRAAYITAAIESVLAQTIPIHEFLVVDDGSDDGTQRVVQRYRSHLRYLHQSNQGKMAAIESALAETTGDLIWIMDDDDVATPNALAALAEPHRRNPDLIFSYGHLVQFTTTENGAIVEGRKSVYPSEDARPFLLKLMEDCFITGHPCVLARRSAYEGILPFDRSITSSVDYYFHLHMALLGPVACVDEIVLLQRQHSGMRGPAAARYEEAERVRRWKQSDRMLIEGMLNRLPLAAFDPTPGGTGAAPARRACLIQRAAIAARKQLWDRALQDLAEAFWIEHDVPLTRLELLILSRVLGCRYGIDEVYRKPFIISRLRKIGRSRPRECGIAGEIGRPLLHLMKNAIRAGRPSVFLDALGLWLRLMDFRSGTAASAAIATRAGKRAVGKLGRVATSRLRW
ncbi:MAG TPA: glycosyltransferase family A protein [Rhizobiaceae bacterium]|nr:glycosyltransferase family A protein [Rhizobiaceae bacterium]